MSNPVLVLWLEAPLQSWGDATHLYRRSTYRHPSKTGLWGLVFSAMGRPYGLEAECRRISGLRVTIYGWQPLSAPFLTDYQIVGGARGDSPWEKGMEPRSVEGKVPVGIAGKPFYKEYLEGAKFAALVEIPTEWRAEIEAAMKKPRRVVFFGRRCCVPSLPPYLGVGENMDEAEKIIARFLEDRSAVLGQHDKHAFLVRDALPDDPEESVRFIPDNPLRYGRPGEYGVRSVRVIE